MESLDTTQLVALAAALGWASGLRLYAVLLITGLVGLAGWVELPAGLHVLQHPMVLGASGFMFLAEFFADKIPGLDSLWDLVQTVVRIPAGAALAAAVFGADHGTMAMVAAVLGGALAATSHTGKATTRAAINTSPEPFSNLGMSLLEDGLVAGGMWLAYAYPLVFLAVLVVILLITIALTWWLWGFLKLVLGRLRRLLSGAPTSP